MAMIDDILRNLPEQSRLPTEKTAQVKYLSVSGVI